MATEDSQQKLKEYLEDILTRNEFDLEEFAYSLSPKTCIKLLNLLDNSKGQENQSSIENNFKAIQALLRAKSTAIETAENEIPLLDLTRITATSTIKQMKEIIIQNINLLDKYENTGLRKYLLQAEQQLRTIYKYTKNRLCIPCIVYRSCNVDH